MTDVTFLLRHVVPRVGSVIKNAVVNNNSLHVVFFDETNLKNCCTVQKKT